MKKIFIIVVVLLLILGGYTRFISPKDEPKDIEEKQNDIIDKKEIQVISKNLIEEFNDRLIQPTDQNNIVVLNFKTKEELINYLSQVSNSILAAEFVNKLYVEKENKLYLKKENLPPLLDLNKPYDLSKESEIKYTLFQSGQNELYGKYDIFIVIENKNAKWSLEVFNTSSEKTPSDENSDVVIDFTDLDSILLLANKEYSLPNDFVPSNLVKPNIPFVTYMNDEVKHMQKIAADAIEELVRDAENEGIKLYGRSGYRSYKTQYNTFYGNVDKYIETKNMTKEEAEEAVVTFSARPGTSEHQTGLTLDITADSVNQRLTQDFGKTKEGIWLSENAHKFGFIIRYPSGKEDITGYIYEPWHLRYVGKEVATEINEKDITFEEFLGLVH